MSADHSAQTVLSVLGLAVARPFSSKIKRVHDRPPVLVQRLPPVLIDDRAGWRDEVMMDFTKRRRSIHLSVDHLR